MVLQGVLIGRAYPRKFECIYIYLYATNQQKNRIVRISLLCSKTNLLSRSTILTGRHFPRGVVIVGLTGWRRRFNATVTISSPTPETVKERLGRRRSKYHTREVPTYDPLLLFIVEYD